MPRLREHPALLWLPLLAAGYAILALVYRDGSHPDAGYHFLLARWGWEDPENFVGVWARPLFTLVYAFPALLGYPAAKLFTVCIACGTIVLAYFTARAAKMPRAGAVVLLLGLQASFLQLSFDTLTETLFAFFLALALFCEVKDRVRMAAFLMSLLPLVRPEGFVLAPVWAALMLADARLGRPAARMAWVPVLALGTAVWWLAALAITGDALYIVHSWPSNWEAKGLYGRGGWLSFIWLLPAIVGPAFAVPALPGAVLLARRRRRSWAAVLGVFFLFHAVSWRFGIFGSAGYPRYFVCVSPLLAFACLEAWNWAADRLDRVRYAVSAVAAGGCALSAVFALLYVDGFWYARNFRGVEDSVSWLRRTHPDLQISRLVWSEAYMCVQVDGRVRNGMSRKLDLSKMPSGTLAFWDTETGPGWWGYRCADFERAGFRLLRRKGYDLHGYLLTVPVMRYGGCRPREISLYYKD